MGESNGSPELYLWSLGLHCTVYLSQSSFVSSAIAVAAAYSVPQHAPLARGPTAAASSYSTRRAANKSTKIRSNGL